MRVVSTSTPSPLVPLPLDSQAQLVSDLLNVLIGVASTTFPLNQVGHGFFLAPLKPVSATGFLLWGFLPNQTVCVSVCMCGPDRETYSVGKLKGLVCFWSPVSAQLLRF